VHIPRYNTVPYGMWYLPVRKERSEKSGELILAQLINVVPYSFMCTVSKNSGNVCRFACQCCC
jgi:hypothetical protein